MFFKNAYIRKIVSPFVPDVRIVNHSHVRPDVFIQVHHHTRNYFLNILTYLLQF